MDKVKHLLEQANIAHYLDKFQQKGFDDLADILSMGEKDLKELAQHTEMFPGHLRRLRHTITAIRNAVPTPKPGEKCVDIPPSSSASNSSSKFELKHFYTTRDEVKLASLNHSCDQGCSCMIDHDKSGGKCRIYRCRSVISKRLKAPREDEADPSPACQYKLHWAWNKKGHYWKLNTKKSHLEHMPFCCSGQHVTKFELVNDPSFVKHANLSKNVTGKTAAREALGGSSGRVAGSVKSYTAKRAVNDVKHFWKNDYQHDWNKLRSWGKEYERKNPNGKFHIETETDTEERCPIVSTVPNRVHRAQSCPPCPIVSTVPNRAHRAQSCPPCPIVSTVPNRAHRAQSCPPCPPCPQVFTIVRKCSSKYRDCVRIWNEILRGGRRAL